MKLAYLNFVSNGLQKNVLIAFCQVISYLNERYSYNIDYAMVLRLKTRKYKGNAATGVANLAYRSIRTPNY